MLEVICRELRKDLKSITRVCQLGIDRVLVSILVVLGVVSRTVTRTNPASWGSALLSRTSKPRKITPTGRSTKNAFITSAKTLEAWELCSVL